MQYDPLIAKLIAYGESRDAAIDRAAAALRMFPILGLRTNVPFLLRLLDDPGVRAGRVHTVYIDEHREALTREDGVPAAAVAAAAVAPVRFGSSVRTDADSGAQRAAGHDPWATLGSWGR